MKKLLLACLLAGVVMAAQAAPKPMALMLTLKQEDVVKNNLPVCVGADGTINTNTEQDGLYLKIRGRVDSLPSENNLLYLTIDAKNSIGPQTIDTKFVLDQPNVFVGSLQTSVNIKPLASNVVAQRDILLVYVMPVYALSGDMARICPQS